MTPNRLWWKHSHRGREVTIDMCGDMGKVHWKVLGFRGGSGIADSVDAAWNEVDLIIDIAEEAES